MNSVKSKYPEYNQDKLDEIEYGLEAIYLTFTKLIVIFSIAYILGVLKELIILLFFYNLLRTTAFGMHAKKSWHCYLISISVFVGGALLCKYVDINIYIKIVLSLIAFVCMILYAPADTYKRPLINAKKRKIYKNFTDKPTPTAQANGSSHGSCIWQCPCTGTIGKVIKEYFWK